MLISILLRTNYQKSIISSNSNTEYTKRINKTRCTIDDRIRFESTPRSSIRVSLRTRLEAKFIFEEELWLYLSNLFPRIYLSQEGSANSDEFQGEFRRNDVYNRDFILRFNL